MSQQLERRRILKALILFSLLLVMALLGRLWILQRLSETALGCRWCIAPGVLSTDLPLLALAGAMFTLSYAVPRRRWSLPWRSLAVAGLAIYLADIAITAQFATRLSLADARIYLGQPDLVWRQLGTLAWWQRLLAVGVVTLLVAIASSAPRHRPCPRTATLTALLWTGIALLGWVIPYPGYVHDWAVRNVVAANLGNGTGTPYSAATRQRLLHDATPAQPSCRPGDATRENVIMLIIESWSPYQSQLWSGLNDWTPELDRLASESIRFERLHAGGFTTNEGLISLFTGRQFTMPMTPPGQAQPFETRWKQDHTLPQQLARNGYHNHFVTSGNLSFTRKGEWLESIGFDSQEGHDHPDYDGIQRQHFDSVPDDVLYARARDAIQELEAQPQPYFTVVENVSSHHPFRHPYTGARDEAAVMRFVDQAAADFIADLKADDFFDNGILVVVSDHRAMTFVSYKESQLLGRAAASRIHHDKSRLLSHGGRPVSSGRHTDDPRQPRCRPGLPVEPPT